MRQGQTRQDKSVQRGWWTAVVAIAAVLFWSYPTFASPPEDVAAGLEWHTSLEDALGEMKDCQKHLLLYVHDPENPGRAARALHEAAQGHFLGSLALFRLTGNENDQSWAAVTKRWGEKVPQKTDSIYFISPDGQLLSDRSLSSPDSTVLIERLKALNAPRRVGASVCPSCSSGWSEWRKVRPKLAQGTRKEVLSEISRALGNIHEGQTCFSFNAEIGRIHQGYRQQAQLELAQLRTHAKQARWRSFYQVYRSLDELSLLEDIATEVDKVLNDVRADPAKRQALQTAARAEVSALRVKKFASLAAHRSEALTALRQYVSAKDVPDRSVTLVFWQSAPQYDDSGKAVVVREVYYAGGYWLGSNRAVVLVWDPKNRRVDGAPDRPHMHQLKVSSPMERRALDLAVHQIYFLAAWQMYDDRLLVPFEIKVDKEGIANVRYVDGWDEGCGHLSEGTVVIDLRTENIRSQSHIL